MRLLTFEKNGRAALGVRDGDHVIDVALAGLIAPGDVSAVLRAGEMLLSKLAKLTTEAPASSRIALDTLRLLPPTVTAGKIVCLGLNYVSHATEVGVVQKPDYPTVFFRANTSLIGAQDPIVRPRISQALDFEGEMVAFIGKTGRHIPLDDALSHVAGYAVFNDVSIRDYQMRTSQWTVGKNFDDTGPFGPEFVSADELPEGATGLNIQTRLNGEVMQNASTSDMIFGVAETIHLLSQCFTLEVGDILVMGTPSGVGNAREPKLFMKPGDVCEVEIEKIGLIRNAIVDEH
jgi:2-keto-4-pentenoate hydratase/2-oxohepta-3-ene-1,7-dioic acid hydratase in catechol pathway